MNASQLEALTVIVRKLDEINKELEGTGVHLDIIPVFVFDNQVGVLDLEDSAYSFLNNMVNE